MPRTQDGLEVLPPSPLEDEQRPLLEDVDGVDNGTLAREWADGGEMNVPLADEPSMKRIIVIMGCLWMGSFLAALDGTIVATLASPISTSFHSSTLLSWIASGYLIANAAIQPLSGRLSDIFGRKAGVIFACTFFAAGTLVCGLAQSAGMMIAGRIIAGAGGGCLNTISSFVASDLIPLRKRGLWQGFANIVYGTGMGLGGVFGGLMNDRLSWRWAFYVQIPFILVAGIMGTIFVDIPIKETDENRLKRVDFLGALTLSGSLVLLLLGLNSGGNLVPWSHPLVLASLPLSAAILLLFVYIEAKVASEPIIPVRLLLRRTVWSACLTNWFTTMAVFSLFYYVPIYFQTVAGVSATAAGTRLVPSSVGAAVGSLGAGFIMRVTGRYWWLNFVTQILMLASVVLIAATFDADMLEWPPYIMLFMNGTAYGAMLTITLLALLAAVGHEYQAVITSASYAFRSTGSTIGITIASAVFQNVLKRRLWERFGEYPGADDMIRKIRDDVGDIAGLPAGWKPGVIDTYVEALRGVWVVVVGLTFLGSVVSLFMREHTLHAKLNRK